ncbi:MAG: hypothetical protein WCG07_03225 [Candidatus Taylorbacteria bacterium]
MKKLFIGVFFLACIGVIIVGIYLFNAKQHGQVFTPLDTAQVQLIQATSSLIINAGSIPYPVATSTIPDGWRPYSNNTLGFDIAVPPTLVQNGHESSVWFAFPKDTYFHWPLQDDAKITVSASSTCASSTIPDMNVATQGLLLNGYVFTRYEGDDAAAGNRYMEVMYTTIVNDVCYSIDFFDHGTNGAGFYVNDQALITQYDTQHSQDLSQVVNIFNSMVSSFQVHK